MYTLYKYAKENQVNKQDHMVKNVTPVEKKRPQVKHMNEEGKQQCETNERTSASTEAFDMINTCTWRRGARHASLQKYQVA